MKRCLLFLMLCAGCRKPAGAAAAASDAAAGRFCDQDLSGVWLNASDGHYAYRFRDHGDVVRGEFLERSDAGALSPPREPILFELHRTQAALSGVMRSTEQTAGGRACPVEFGVDVTGCAEGRLQAQVETEVAVTEACRRQTAEDGGELPAQRTEFVFVRAPAHPSDGGEATKAD